MTKTLLNESSVIQPTENIFTNLDFSEQMHKPFRVMDKLSSSENQQNIPNFIVMPEITVKNEAQELLDECMYLAEYTLKDEDFAPEKIPTPVIVPSPPKVSQEGIRKSERNSQGVGAITRSLQNSQNL